MSYKPSSSAIGGTPGQWTVNTTGDIVPITNNTDDIGNGTTNPRTIRANTSVVTPQISGFPVELGIPLSLFGQAGITLTTGPEEGSSEYDFNINTYELSINALAGITLDAAGNNVAINQANGIQGFFGNATNGVKLTGFLGDVEESIAVSGAPNVLAVNETRKILTNTGTSAMAFNSLPSAIAGLYFEGYVDNINGIRFTASAGDQIRGDLTGGGGVISTSAAGGFIQSTGIGSSITLRTINATTWQIASIGGIWTIDS